MNNNVMYEIFKAKVKVTYNAAIVLDKECRLTRKEFDMLSTAIG